MANILVFDTSSQWCSVSLSADGELYSRAELQPRKHAQLLLPMIDAVLAEAGISPQKLDGVAYGKGPGSFTGLRIAISAAQGICLATETPALGISSLEALAWQAMEKYSVAHVLAITNAHMGEVFCGAYRRNIQSETKQGLLAAEFEDCLIQPDNFDPKCVEDIKTYIGAGDGFPLLVPEQYDGIASVDEDIAPLASSMMALAQNAWERQSFSPIEEHQPVYLRDTVAWKKLSEQPSLLKK